MNHVVVVVVVVVGALALASAGCQGCGDPLHPFVSEDDTPKRRDPPETGPSPRLCPPSSTVLDFGVVDVGAAPSLTFRAENCGTAPLTIEGASIESAEGPYALNTAFVAEVVLEVGDGFDFEVAFSPVAAGLVSGSLSIETTAGLGVVSLVGTGRTTGAGCGDGVLDDGERCDPGIGGGAGSCPSSCAASDACVSRTLVGGACDRRCVDEWLGAVNDDGCCLGDEYRDIDSDCGAAEFCATTPFAAEVFWKWDDAPALLLAPMSATPLVLQLTDDDGDGDTDADDVPDVFMLMFGMPGLVPNGDGMPSTIAAVSGDSGATIFVKETTAQHLSPMATPAAADLDGDGSVEIVAVRLAEDNTVDGLVAFSRTGDVVWESDLIESGGRLMEMAGGPAIADVDGDGDAEITFGPRLFDHQGHIVWSHPSENDNGDIIATFSVFVDVDPEPGLEILEGGTLYSATGEVLWANDSVGYPYSVVADCDADGKADILLVGQNDMVLLDDAGEIKAGPRPSAGRYPPAAGDVDGDGRAEFVIPGAARIVAIDCHLDEVSAGTILDLSGACAPVLFDFDGDGALEIVHADEHKLHVFDGRNGTELFEQTRNSATGTEGVAVADIDHDGHAEIIVPQGTRFGDHGVVTLKSAGDPWMASPSIWNQHVFHPGLINEDQSLPPYAPTWFGFNAMRAQRALGDGACGP